MLAELASYAVKHGLATAPGFAPKTARWAIWLDETGELINLRDLRTADGRDRSFGQCPDLRQNELIAGGVTRSHFLLDTVDVVALYGVEKVEETKRKKVLTKHEYFIKLLEDAATDCPALALCACLLRNPDALESVRERLSAAKAKPTEKITFQVGMSFPVDSTDWHGWWQRFRATLNGHGRHSCQKKMRCFVTGELVEPLKTHPKIKGLASVGGQGTGCVLIGVDKEAFASYGLTQSDNAALSAESATLYANALNDLIAKADPPIAGTMLIYWFKENLRAEDDPLNWLKGIFGPEDDELAALQRARQLLESIKTGAQPDLSGNIFHGALISASGGRVMVRNWFEGDLSELVQNALQWFADLDICTRDGRKVGKAPGLYALMYSLVQKELDELPRPLVDEMWCAALFGRPIPRFAISAALQHIRSEVLGSGQISNHARMALIKAYHVRMRRFDGGESALTPYLNEEHPSQAYQAGRLMAVLAAIQRAALGDVGAGVVQRYYAAASATPALVLGRLVRQCQFHLNKLDKGLAAWYERILASIIGRLGDRLPAALDLEGQSLFAVGYYQQAAFLRSGKQEDQPVKEGVLSE